MLQWHEECLLISFQSVTWGRGRNRTSPKPFAGANAFPPDAAIAAVPSGSRDGVAIARPAGDRNQPGARGDARRSQEGNGCRRLGRAAQRAPAERRGMARVFLAEQY